MNLNLSQAIKEKAKEIGFDLVGISPVDKFPETEAYKEWLKKGFAGKMEYMERSAEKRKDIKKVLPSARSVISCALNYNTDYPYSVSETDKSRGWISRYAWGDDYHYVMEEKLKSLLEYIKKESRYEVEAKIYVDTGPVLDRVYAKYGGIGWFGKNTCILDQDIGSWFFIGEMITNLELICDEPLQDRCGSCTMCIDACPTGALLKPYVLDSRLCISYLTIELRDDIPINLRDKVGNNIYGCDICQDVCPWNRKAEVTDEPSFKPREGLYSPSLLSLLNLSEEEYKETFRQSPIKRAKRRGLVRNVLIAMGNSGNKGFIRHLEGKLKDTDPMIRAHAAWAIWKLGGKDAYEILEKYLATETDSEVKEEITSLKVNYMSRRDKQGRL